MEDYTSHFILDHCFSFFPPFNFNNYKKKNIYKLKIKDCENVTLFLRKTYKGLLKEILLKNVYFYK